MKQADMKQNKQITDLQEKRKYSPPIISTNNLQDYLKGGTVANVENNGTFS